MVRNVNYVGSEMFCFRVVALYKTYVISIVIPLFYEGI